MNSAAKRKAIAGSFVLGPTALFCICLLLGRDCSSALMFFALMIFTHMPAVALPSWAVFRGRRVLAFILGWLAFFLGEVGFFAFYLAYYKIYGWPTPDLPGGIIFGALFGWGFGLAIVAAAEWVKQWVDKRWPIDLFGRPKPPLLPERPSA